jgi:NADPH:quinone reductase
VEEAGEGVTAFKRGDEVYGMTGGVGGLQGSLAEFVAADANLLAHKPKRLSMREAAALPLSTITAWEGLVDRAAVHAGQTVQIAHAGGSRVFATVSPDKTEIATRFGATAIDYKALSSEEYLAKYTDGAGFEVIYDTVGGKTLDDSFASVRRYTGHVLSCLGWGSHPLAPLSFRGATYWSFLPNPSKRSNWPFEGWRVRKVYFWHSRGVGSDGQRDRLQAVQELLRELKC